MNIHQKYFMKTLFLFLCLIITMMAKAQLKTSTQNQCGTLVVDILDGRVNGVESDFTAGQIKKALPCFTSEEAEGGTSKCGGAVFYKDKDIYFYTGRKYVEIREKFKGRLSVPLMGAARNSLFKWLGNPVIKDVAWDAYQTSYGTLVVYYNKASKVNKLQFSTLNTETLNLCQ
jgi:hypothetical protein